MTYFVLDGIEPSPETHTYVFAERRLKTQAKSNSSIGPRLKDLKRKKLLVHFSNSKMV